MHNEGFRSRDDFNKLKTKSKFERYTYIEQLNIRRVI